MEKIQTKMSTKDTPGVAGDILKPMSKNQLKKLGRKKAQGNKVKDQSIQGTNDSSIVSKRSVERIYTGRGSNGKGSSQLFRYFVPKPVRRSPIINRGYWTRMKAIKWVVQQCIDSLPPGDKLTIVNLGCGFDPLAYEYCDHPKIDRIVDVDYPDLIKRKLACMKAAPELMKIVGDEVGVEKELANNILFDSKSGYTALACDLKQLQEFAKLLGTLCSLKNDKIVFIAEVSMTYMVQKTADALIEWIAQNVNHAQFALLEQIIPSGKHHPFAKTMLKHFKSINTPLHSVEKYPALEDQVSRFYDRGWKTDVLALDLYQFWRFCVSQEDKDYVESVEAFDEWEEFILFCQHYFILFAKNFGPKTTRPSGVGDGKGFGIESPRHSLQCEEQVVEGIQRKFAASCHYTPSSFLIHGGLASNREDSCVLLSENVPESISINKGCNPPARMSHSLCKVGNDYLLVGGRQSPSTALCDCWLLEKLGKSYQWKQVDSLPEGRYSHTAIGIEDDMVLVYGAHISMESAVMVWRKGFGWKKYVLENLPCRQSAAVAWNAQTRSASILGGFEKAGFIAETRIELQVHHVGSDWPEITFNTVASDAVLNRYGAKAIFANDRLFLAGGVGNTLLNSENNVVSVDGAGKVNYHFSSSPLLSGFNISMNQSGDIICFGGGAVCFSFGSYWNPLLTFNSFSSALLKQSTYHVGSPDFVSIERAVLDHIPIRCPNSKQEFEKICEEQNPALFKKNDLGSCTVAWKDPEYLISKVGKNTAVVAHVTNSENLSFIAKNFKYETVPFAELIEKIFGEDKAEKYYLRSLSLSKPKDLPSKLSDDFPQLAHDFKLPDFLSHIQQTNFSSPLRIASPYTSMWLHYDVTANVLCQIVGSKKVRLYPPRDVTRLNFEPGSSSSSIVDIFSLKIAGTSPLEFIMEPGDILYLPPLWLHATVPLTPSISVNCFWKDLPQDVYAAGRDIYGNRDIKAYENGRTGIAKIVSTFDGLPTDVRQFYLQRLKDELDSLI